MFTSEIGGGKWPASLPGHFTRSIEPRYAFYVEVWVGPIADFEALQTGKVFLLPEIENRFVEGVSRLLACTVRSSCRDCVGISVVL